MRGGGHLGTCTAGFTLRGLTGPNHKRIATAGHCGESAETRVYQNHSGDGGQTTVTRFWRHQGEWGDLAYYDTGSFNALQTFYWDWNEKRYVESRSGRPSAGDVICHFGKTSGRSCAAVWDADRDIGDLDGMVVMNSDIGQSGDSGGPWYYGSTAIGIHSGDHILNDVRRSMFTPAYLYRNRNFDVFTR